jgi:hypothetical protein
MTDRDVWRVLHTLGGSSRNALYSTLCYLPGPSLLPHPPSRPAPASPVLCARAPFFFPRSLLVLSLRHPLLTPARPCLSHLLRSSAPCDALCAPRPCTSPPTHDPHLKTQARLSTRAPPDWPHSIQTCFAQRLPDDPTSCEWHCHLEQKEGLKMPQKAVLTPGPGHYFRFLWIVSP